MIKHLFQRTVTKNGKKIKAWYYWFYDENGKQVRRSCGSDGKPCLTKKQAEVFLDSLNDDELLNKEPKFKDYCKNFYDLNSRFIKKQIARGSKYQDNTLYQKRHYMGKFLDKFGKRKVSEITAGEIENWLIDMECSNSVKNNILSIIEEIESELYNEKIIQSPLHIKHFKRNTVEKGILTIQEIAALFPNDYEELIKVWRLRYTEKESDIYSFATAIFTILSTGMRSSEVRALQWNQFVRKDAILINAMIDSKEERVNRLKKWTDDNKKWRVTVLPDKTVRMIELLKLDRNENDYVFVYNNKPLTTYFLLDHFKWVLKRNSIDCDARNITIHSLRFTYNSLMRGEIPDSDLRLMIGHTSEVMTEYYDKSKAIEHLDTLLLNKSHLNEVFN